MEKQKNTSLYDTLYDMLSVDEKSDNPFEPDAIDKPLSEFYSQYIYETASKPENADNGWLNIINIIDEAQRNAFKIDFETAVTLIVKGGVNS